MYVSHHSTLNKMNRKAFLSVLAALLVLPSFLQAQPITSRRAAKIASKYIDKVAKKAHTRAVESAKSSYYIFNDADGRGFVIVAGDGRMNEVVGYSKTGRINMAAMPPALQVYLADYERYVKALGTTNVHYEATATKQSVGPLLKTKWNQDSPYNDMAPLLDGRRPPIGCVATAVSQVMNYHQWPKRGKGEYSYTPSYRRGELSYGLQQVNFEKSVYQWDKMTQDCKEPEARTAVAKLMYDVSVGVRMDFKPEASGAHIDNAVDALKNYFDYQADLIQREYMSSAAFMETLRNELRDGFPVVFSGSPETSGMGHAWVCDGFDEQGLFSMNWGWGGASDGYFDLSYLNPNERGAGGSGIGGFVRTQRFIRVHPNKPDTKKLESLRMAFDFKENGYICPDKTETTRQEGLELKFENIGNFSSHEAFKSKIGIGIFKQLDDKPIKTIDFGDKYTHNALTFEACFYEVKEKVTFENLQDGIYYLHPMTMTIDKETEWHKTGRACYIKIQVAGDKVSVIERTDIPALKLVNTPTGAMEVPSGTLAEYSIRIANMSTLHFKGDLQIVLKGQGKEYTYQPVNSTYRFMDNTEQTRKISIDFPSEMETGEYELHFMFDYQELTTNNGKHELTQLETPLKVKVWNTSKDAYLNYMGTYITNGYVQMLEDKLSVEQHLDMQIFAKAINMGKKEFKGELHYMLEDVDSKQRLNLENKPYVLAPGASAPTPLPIFSMKDHLSKMAAGHSYRVVTEVYNEGKKEYEWVHRQQVLMRDFTTDIHNHSGSEGYKATYQRDNQTLTIDTDKLLPSLAVYSANGTLVFSRQHLQAGHHEISLSHLGSGIYIIATQYNNERKVMRIMK